MCAHNTTVVLLRVAVVERLLSHPMIDWPRPARVPSFGLVAQGADSPWSSLGWCQAVDRLRSVDGIHPPRMTDDRVPALAARATVFVALVGTLVVLASSDGVHAAVLRAFESSNRLIAEHSTAGPVVFVLLSALSAMLAFFSSAVLVPPAVIAWGPVLSAFLLWLGWLLGGIASYTLARLLGRPVVRRLASARLLARYEARLTRETPFGLVLLFQLALPSELPGYLLGLVRYPPARYLAALAIAEFPYAVGTMLLGESFVERRIGLLVSFGGAAAIVGVLLTRALRRRLS